ncbi:MAG: protease pro-enzyme activation domain-containing protein [Acidobacteriaceae bacterium]
MKPLLNCIMLSVSSAPRISSSAPVLLAAAIALGTVLPAHAQVSTQVSTQFRTAPRSLISQRLDRTQVTTIPGAMRAGISSYQDMGEVESTLPMEHIQLLLRRPAERQAAFDAEVEALHTPGNPSYHHWLTPAIVGSEFGLSDADIATLTGYLQSEGFTVNFVSPSATLIDFTGTAAQVENSFQTQIHSVQSPSGELRYTAIKAAFIPSALAPAIVGFVSLSNAAGPRPMLRKAIAPIQIAASAQVPGPRPQNTETIDSSTYYDLGPQDFYTIYNENPLLKASTPINGSGQTVALIEETDINTNDVTNFRTIFNVLPNKPALTVHNGAGSVNCTDPGILNTKADDEEDEAVLDTEWAGAVAPSANLLYMSCATTTTTDGIILSAEAVIYNNLADTMSLSYGEYEGGFTTSEQGLVNDLWEQAAAQGETVVVSSGDSGSDVEDDGATVATHGLNVNGLSSTAYNVAAGGTDFQDAYNQGLGDTTYEVSTFWNATNTTGDSSAISYVPETTWNDTCAGSLVSYYATGSTTPTAFCDTKTGYTDFLPPGGGSGGISSINARPSWQNATVYGLPSTPAYRLQPDVSLFASNGFWGHLLDFYESDVSTTSLQYAGGTSFVAPQLAAVFALVNQSTGQRQGQPDYVLYAMAGIEYGTTAATGACNGSGASGTGTTSSLPASSCIFHDIETGSISQACRKSSLDCYNDKGNYGILSTSATTDSPAYPAAEGYDLATGLGSINITNLVNNWQSTTNSVLYTPTVKLTSTLASYTYGAPSAITYTATVSGSGSFPTGSVAFSGAPTIGAVGSADVLTISAGCKTAGACTESTTQAYTPSSTLPGGVYTITGTYSPTNENYNSATGTIGLTVNKQTPTLTVSSAATPAGNLTGTLTGTLAFTGTGLAPTGGVNFTVNGGSVVNGTCTGTTSPITCTASYPISTLATGTYTISATYPGDTNYNAVGPKTATLTLTSNPSTVSFSVSSPQHTMAPTITLSAASNNKSGALTYSVVSGPATVTGNVATFTGAGTVELEVSQAAGTTYSLTTATTTFTVLAGSIWIGDSTNDVSTFDLLGNVIIASPGLSGAGVGTIATPQGIAFDSSGDLWVASSTGVSEFNHYGAPASSTPFTTGGISTPISLAIDGAGTAWIANANGSVSAISNSGTALSPSTGFAAATTASTSGGLAIDLSGNVWVTSSSGNTVTEILGAAAPIAPPSTSLANKTTGAQP